MNSDDFYLLTASTGLPQPKIAYIEQLRSSNQQQKAAVAEVPKESASKAQKPREDSFGSDPTADPWASPANKRVPPPSTAAHTQPNGGSSTQETRPSEIGRTTSNFTTTSMDAEGQSPPEGRPPAALSNAWGSYNGTSGGFSEQPTLGGGFGESVDDQTSQQQGRPTQPSVGASVLLPSGTGESVTVTLLPEKEGMFLFQHHNYEVKTTRRGSSVVRRYSDFVWLLDCLQKRYPFRRLPLLPPKRVQGMSNKPSEFLAHPLQ